MYSVKRDFWKCVNDQTMMSNLTECVDLEEAVMGKFTLLHGKGVVVGCW